MYRAFISRVSIIYNVLLVCSFLSACGTPSPQTRAACTSWQTVSSPNPGHTENKLYDAFAISSNNIWATGYYSGTPTYSDAQTLIEHWNGRAWSAISTPELHADLNGTVLHDVSALAPDNVWAVGSTSSVEHGQLALIEHWDGNAWSVVPSPQPQGHAFTNDADLWSLSALAPDDIWADGYYDLAGVTHYLVEHWDGHAWNIFPIPVPAKTLGILYQIAAVSDYNVWVFSSDSTLLHWNGHSWSVALASQNGYLSPIAGIAAQPDGKLWLVGSKGKTGLSKTLIETSCQ